MTVGRRDLGVGGPSLSQITYGTMRMAAAGDRPAVAADWLCRLHDHGIDTHHSSREYECHGIYLAALAEARRSGRAFRHIVKLSEPGFDHRAFDGRRLTAKLDQQLRDHDVDMIDSVQWLFRTPEPADTRTRVDRLRRQAVEITEWAETQRTLGKLANLSTFPYSADFLRAVMDTGISSTPATYLNLAELDALPVLDGCDGFVALRPLAGGRLTVERPPADDLVDPRPAAAFLKLLPDDRSRLIAALEFPLLHPRVTTIVLSANTIEHIDVALQAAGAISPDERRFIGMAEAVNADPPSAH